MWKTSWLYHTKQKTSNKCLHEIKPVTIMPRKSVKNTFIANDYERKTSYMKRKKSFLKMTEQLSTLCGIEACAIVYSPYHCEPEIWPSESGVLNVVGKFRDLPEWEQSKKMVNQEGFVAQSILKGKEKMRKLVKDNKDTEITMFMYECLNTGRVQPYNNMTTADLNYLSSIIEQKLKNINTRLETLNVIEMSNPASQPQSQMQTAAPHEMPTLLNYGHGSDMNANTMESEWLLDLLNVTIMSQKRVKNAYIANDTERKTSYGKRKRSLLKKTAELSTLCGIEACAIVYSIYDPVPEIWPSESGVQNVLRKFRTLPEWEQSKKMVNQEGFIAQSILKSKEKMGKLVTDNKDTEMSMFIVQCLNTGRVQPQNIMTTADMNNLSSIIEQKLKEISTRLETLNVNEMTPHQPEIQTSTLVVAPEEMTLLNYGHAWDMNPNPIQRQCFMDLLNGNVDETVMPLFGDIVVVAVETTSKSFQFLFCFSVLLVTIMSQKRVKNALIANDSERKISFTKRTKSLLKKTGEISTLCDIEACAIVYSTYNREPEIWPSESGVRNVVEKFRTIPEFEQNKRMENLESFITQRIQKANEQKKKLMKDNREKEMSMFMFQCLNEGRVLSFNNMTAADLNDLSSVIEQKLKDINRRLEMLNVNVMTESQPQPHQQPQMQTLPYQQPQMQTLPYQQSEIQTLPYQQSQIQTLLYQQSQIQTLPYQQPQMQTLTYQPQIQTAESQTQIQIPAYHPQVQTAPATTLLNYGHGSDMNANPLERQWFMDLQNGNVDETVTPLFGDKAHGCHNI
ncbi:Agamous-like MADS-box protein AGL80, partial [Mucuna pruriens]